ncbi:NUDIX hydrolase [Microbacterium hominis]|uniref:NUDIX hydrolase n=1 Tax=Microbacterium hominis TaxID=162426 RepID=A0A7D4U2D4_9MICO|nr:NUDIX hydrolase [Microbacterium hominis]QKJ17965.1 NUDIX hydrolase [Microbacterium hominis]
MDLRVAAYAIITDDDGRVLLAHWNEGRRSGWTLPGGGIEPGEDPLDAMRREVREETGFRVVSDGLLGIHSRVIPAAHRTSEDTDVPLHAIRIVYRASIIGGRLRNEVDGSTDRAEWFAPHTIDALHKVKLVGVGLEMAGIATRAPSIDRL